MPKVSNATSLIGLARANKFNLLKEICKEIIIPEAVYHEVVTRSKGRAGEKEVKKAFWVKVKKVKGQLKIEAFRKQGLGLGESEALTLAKEVGANLLITDDRRAGEVAESLGLKVVKSVEILLLAKKKGLIPNVKDVMDEMLRQNFWIDEETYQEALQKAKEL